MEANRQSLWQAISDQAINFESLQKNVECDVAIIGGGITGITAAQALSKTNLKIAIFEKNKIGHGTTGFSTGNLYAPIQPFYQAVKQKFNQQMVNNIIKDRLGAIDHIEETTKLFGIECHFARRPWIVHSNDKDKIKILQNELKVLLLAGCDVQEIKELDLPIAFKKAIVLANQARFNPLQYCIKLAQALVNRGCFIYENTRILAVDEVKNHCILRTQDFKIKAKKVIMSTHVPLGIKTTPKIVRPYRSYVIAATLKNDSYPDGNYWDTELPHHTISTHSQTDSMELNIIAVAGNHHKTGQDRNAKDRFVQLEKYLANIYEIDSILYRWSAQHYHAVDSYPYIGLATNSKKIYIATGFFADGLVYGVLAGNTIANFILHAQQSKSSIYRPNRFTPIVSASANLQEGINISLQYLKDLPNVVDTNDVHSIKKDQGKTIQQNGEKIAAYRDKKGNLHYLSAVCTHMKGIVSWNNAEKTWDCPCHGSRFTVHGDVIEGPAYLPLAKRDLC